jgi:hypothetical protein
MGAMFSSNANAQKPRNNFGVVATAAPVNNTRRNNSAAPNVPVNTNANATRPNNSANAAAPMTMSQSGGRKKTRKNRKESRKSKKSKRGCRK